MILQELNDMLSDKGVEFKTFTLTSYYYNKISFIFKIVFRVPSGNEPKSKSDIIKMFGKYIEEVLDRHGIEFSTFDEEFSSTWERGSNKKPGFSIAFDIELSEEELAEKWESYQARPNEQKPKQKRKSAPSSTIIDDIKDYVNDTFGEGAFEFYHDGSGGDIAIYPAKKTASSWKQLQTIKKWIEENTLLESILERKDDDGNGPFLYAY